MCGRFSVGFEADYLSRKLGAVLRGDTDYPSPTLQINPTDPVVFLRGRAGDDSVGRELAAGRWGLVPTFSKSFDSRVPTWNARSETAGSIPAFRASLPKWRAVVPASAYYEWKKSGPGRKDPKQRYIVEPQDELITFAGLFAPWRDESIEDKSAPGAWRLSCSILTMDSPPEGVHERLHNLHDRIPVPISADMIDDWIDPKETRGQALLDAVLGEAYGLASAWTMRPVELMDDNTKLVDVANPAA